MMSVIFLAKQFLLCWHYAYALGTYYAQNYAGIIGWSRLPKDHDII